MYQNLNSSEFEKAIENNADAVIIDVRTAGEFYEGIIPGAINIDMMGGSFAEQVKALDPNKSYYLYCRSGARSASACGAMQQWGFKKLYNLSGGIMMWQGNIAEPQNAHR
jgi:rhodanese-related sulfurtransferase